MTKLSSAPAGAVLVAIGMVKNRQEVLIERPEGGRRRRMTVLATKTGTTNAVTGGLERILQILRPHECANDLRRPALRADMIEAEPQLD